MKTKDLLILLIAVSCLSGCAMNYISPVKPPMGGMVTVVKAPLTYDFDKTPCNQNLVKVSQNQTYYVHDILLTGMNIAWDGVDIPMIARKGGLTKVYYADYEFLNVLGVFAKYTVNVYGN